MPFMAFLFKLNKKHAAAAYFAVTALLVVLLIDIAADYISKNPAYSYKNFAAPIS